MYGVLRLGVSCSVFLSHSAYSVSAWAALLLASFGFGKLETSRISLMACASPPREKSFWRPLAADLHDVSVDADQFHETLALEKCPPLLGRVSRAARRAPRSCPPLVDRALRHFLHSTDDDTVGQYQNHVLFEVSFNEEVLL